ncbi:c71d6614-feba-4f01-a5a1-2952a5d48573-CDS [Sclerotinia trifoliorum]|uniref:C71d6614-feba-4f01-a5a1-2952a5d48573-CDS n=1 Tax=Sclerotinia trifoliorum TaxID=28548 RepID=A0A8H2W4K5_9HELO|nr:c71d6614-feba-4f01-a5a1-2952a5d48573-CDS [Sclerotinia trifoliorum]
MESFEEMQSRHCKEQKDFQGRITQKKKGATKKTRKGVNNECEELERQLKERQAQEIASLNGSSVPDINDVPELDEEASETSANAVDASGVDNITDSLEKSSIAETAESEAGQPKKRNRQKERLARRAAEQEAAVEEARKEAANMPDEKEVERKRMQEEFTSRNLHEKQIRPDGHCLFSAIADQLSQAGIPLGPEAEGLKDDQRYKVVRKAAATYIEGHPDDFVPFLDEPLENYVHKIRDTAEWGGHLELLALAKTYNVEICVLQNGATQKIEPGTEKKTETIHLAYYRHGFGLGEHYNSLRRAP